MIVLYRGASMAGSGRPDRSRGREEQSLGVNLLFTPSKE